MTVDGIDSATSRAVRVILLGMLLLAGGSCGGCIMADGSFTYHARGTLVADESGRPLAGVALMLALEDWFQEEELRWFDENAVVTDASGRFELSCSTGLAWSQTYVLGFIPLERFGLVPTPPPLKEILLMVREDRQWRFTPLTLKPDQQSKCAPIERWINLGTVRLHPGDLRPLRIRKVWPREVGPASQRAGNQVHEMNRDANRLGALTTARKND